MVPFFRPAKPFKPFDCTALTGGPVADVCPQQGSVISKRWRPQAARHLLPGRHSRALRAGRGARSPGWFGRHQDLLLPRRPPDAGSGNGGFTFDIVPGDPDTSILYFRTDTTKVGAMMPLLGRSLTHRRGAELLHAWIAAMPPDDCVTTP